MWNEHRCPRCGQDKWDDHETRPKNLEPKDDVWKCLSCRAVMCSNQIIVESESLREARRLRVSKPSGARKAGEDFPILSHENFEGEPKGFMQEGVGGPRKKIYVCGPVVLRKDWDLLDEDSRNRIVGETQLLDLIRKSPLTKPAVLGKSMEDDGGREA